MKDEEIVASQKKDKDDKSESISLNKRNHGIDDHRNEEEEVKKSEDPIKHF